jgi:DNA-binding transcriptional regulator YhcF (GntR family)
MVSRLLSIRDLAEETGIARSTVHRPKQKIDRDAETEAVGTDKVEPEQ